MPVKTAEIIAIGDEMIGGDRLDTNTQWLAQHLTELGCRVDFHSTVGDDFDRQVHVFRTAMSRVDLVLTTGGLGPTADDLTRQVVATVCDRPLELHSESLAHIEGLFQKYGRPMPDSNRLQAMFPRGTTVIPNPQGTAPGIDLEVVSTDRKVRLFCVPGVPAEMKEMWSDHLQPVITTLVGGSSFVATRVIHTFGSGESHVEELLGNLIERTRNPLVGITASEAIISLRIVSRGESADAAHAAIEPIEAFIRARLGNLVFGVDGETMEEATFAALTERSSDIVIVDEGLHGDVASSLIHVATGRKAAALGNSPIPNVKGLCGTSTIVCEMGIGDTIVDWETATEPGSESQAILRGILAELQRRFRCPISLFISPVERDNDGIGYFFAAMLAADRVEVERFRYYGHSSFRHRRSVKQVLNMIRLSAPPE